jgi:hypothetical protein
MLKRWSIVQQLTLASTLISWIAIHQAGLVVDVHVMSLDHFRMGLFFLFCGPLAFSAITPFAELLGWNRYFIMVGVVCIGQWGIGFFELGNALRSYPLVITGFILSGMFVLVLSLAVASWRDSTSAS